MMPRMRMLLLFVAATVYVSSAQTNNGSNNKKQPQQPRSSSSDEPIKFSTKAKDSCFMTVTPVGNYTRMRVSCKGPSQGQTPGRSYNCDFKGNPSLCRAYNANPRHYFTQIMWELRKLSHACQGPKIYRPPMCKKYPDTQMTFLPKIKTTMPKPTKTIARPTEQPESTASNIANQYCWKSLHSICTYFISLFQ